MSVSALTTAVAVAAAPVPNGGAPAPVDAFGYEPVALAQSTAALQSVETGQPTEPATPIDPAQSTEPVLSPDPPISTQPESPAPAPVGGQSEIIVTGRRPSLDDPLEELNSASFEVTQTVDESIVAPLAFAYEDVMPRPVRKGLRNFLHNLGEPIVFLNFMLQLKPGKAAETLGRLAINTTLGLGGLIDVAKRKPFNLPYRRNGFANTLGYYGVKPGPYFFLPLVGSTTLRDFIGNRLDLLVLPLAFGRQLQRPAFVIPVAVLSELDHRIEFDDELRAIQATKDPYVAARTYYLRKRQAEIDALRGRGTSTIVPIGLAPASSDPASAPTSPAPAPDSPPRPNSTGL